MLVNLPTSSTPTAPGLCFKLRRIVPYIPHQAKKSKRSTPTSPSQAPLAGVTEAPKSKPSKDGRAKEPRPGPKPTVVEPVLGEPGPSGAHAPVGELDYEPSYPDSDDYPREDALEVVEPRLTPAGEAAERRRAVSLSHLMTHVPMCKYCPYCRRAKARKKPALRKKGGARAENFGDQCTCDHLVCKNAPSVGIDDE